MALTPHERPPPKPGRHCPVHYRYAPGDLAREPDLAAGILYVVGGLYGNRFALATILELAAQETDRVTLAFNGDFNWFNVDHAGFAAVNDEVLNHHAIRGNVETEIAGDDNTAGCGCGYPDWVDDGEVERSNRILARLRETALAHPALRARLGALPMHLVAEVEGVRVAIMHGDAESLAGWSYSQEALAASDALAQLSRHFDVAGARVFACSHTCLPVVAACEARHGRCLLINNGAAGMPNFQRTTYGLVTRIAPQPCNHARPLYGTRLGRLHIDALCVHYDQERWKDAFLGNWPPGTPAHASYFDRIVYGPRYAVSQAIRLPVSPKAVQRSTP